ncbi:hypothetical protein HK101_002308 [Irineochytrium annulatum]|nr:hypothetical protein HK101_002308 [Irineochytrium annulatum]
MADLQFKPSTFDEAFTPIPMPSSPGRTAPASAHSRRSIPASSHSHRSSTRKLTPVHASSEDLLNSLIVSAAPEPPPPAGIARAADEENEIDADFLASITTAGGAAGEMSLNMPPPPRRSQEPLDEGLASWLPDLLGRDEPMTMEDLQDSFVLVQILSVLSPTSIDLAWYTTDGAFSCVDLHSKNVENLTAGLEKCGIVVDPGLMDGLKDGGDVAGAVAEIAGIMWRWKNQRQRGSRVDRIRSGGVRKEEAAEKEERTKSGRSKKEAEAEKVEEKGGVEGGREGNAEPQLNEEPNKSNGGMGNEEPHEKSNDTAETSAEVDATPRDRPVEVETGEDEPDFEPEHEPSERVFKPCLRWLLRTLIDKSGERISLRARVELEEMLESVDLKDKHLPAGPLIPALVTGALYHVACRIVMPPMHYTKENIVDTFIPTKRASVGGWVDREDGFLDTLIRAGHLDFKIEYRDSVRAMIKDRTPFYESIHCNIMDALMDASIKKLEVNDVLNHLRYLCYFFGL